MTDFLFNLGSLSLVMAALILLLTAADFAFGRRITARARYLLWIVVILRLCLIADFDFLPHLVEIPMNPASETELPPTEESTDSGSVTPADKDLYRLDDEVQTIARPDPVPADSIRVIDPVNILFAVWLTGALLQIVYTAVGYAVTSADLKKHLHSADERMKTILTNAADSMEIGRVPALYVSGEVRSPMLMGIFRPMIVLPDTGMDDNSAAAVLAHELTHLKRRDLIVKLLCVIASSLHWFNPLVWLTQRSCVRYMELSCDEEVLAGKNTDVRAAYGNVMLDILRRCSDNAITHSSLISRSRRLRWVSSCARTAAAELSSIPVSGRTIIGRKIPISMGLRTSPLTYSAGTLPISMESAAESRRASIRSSAEQRCFFRSAVVTAYPTAVYTICRSAPASQTANRIFTGSITPMLSAGTGSRGLII